MDFRAGINNPTYKYYIDFAAEHGIEYVILDEGWAVNLQADMMQVIPEIDLQELVDYGKSKNVGIILWAGYWAFARDMENVVKHYSDMGVKGFKVDFLDRDDQEMVNFVYKASEVCAKYKMLVDFHGVFKPTGLQRTYPNVLNYEGVNGLEQMKWSSEKEFDMVTYDVTIPFIRMIAGPMDYTQGAMRNAARGNHRSVNSEPMSQGTRCRQLATYVIFESPFNMLCDAPSNYRREKECTEFISNIPTIWDETVSLAGKVSEYVAIARRHGNDWYIGALTNWTPRELDLDLSFLGEGDYTLELFKDGINADRAARVDNQDRGFHRVCLCFFIFRKCVRRWPSSLRPSRRASVLSAPRLFRRRTAHRPIRCVRRGGVRASGRDSRFRGRCRAAPSPAPRRPACSF